MVTWRGTIFLQGKMQHRTCELREYSWFIIFLFLTYSRTFLLGLGGLCRQWGPVSFALSAGQGGPPLLQVSCSSHALSKGEHAPSRVAQNWQARARQQQPVPGIPDNPSALCLTGFVPGFNPVFILEHAGWPKRWVELESLVSQPGGACRAARH